MGLYPAAVPGGPAWGPDDCRSVPAFKCGAGHGRTVAGGGKLRLYLFPVGTFGLCCGGYEAAAFLPADQLLCILRQAGVF